MENKFIGIICLAFSSFSAPAFSDISVEEVWADTKKWMLMDPSTAVGFGAVENFGDRLVAKDIRIVYDDGNFIVTAGISEIEIKELGDGSVELIYPEVIPISLSIGSFEEAINIDIELDLGDFRYVVDGTSKELTYTVNSPKIQISIVDFGALKDKITASAALTIRDLKGTHRTLDAGDFMGLVSNLELESISLDDLDIQGLGLEVTGDGSFVFDNDDLITIPGIPRPRGSAEVQLIGGNTFIDTLINMGILTQDYAMQARMMLMLFAKPDPSVADKLSSRWEITEDGQITANGQRLR